MPKKIRKAVLPVAGVGTRFLPATKAIPKELLPIVDKPVLQFLVEEAVAAGIEEIIFVVSRGKEAIREHFSTSRALERLLAERGKKALLRKIKDISKLARFRYVYQDEPLGDGHAILQARKLVGNEPFLVLFGDDLVWNKIPATVQLKKIFEKTGSSVIALQKVPHAEVSRYGIVAPTQHSARFDREARRALSPLRPRSEASTQHSVIPDSGTGLPTLKTNANTVTIAGFIEKPKPKDAPSNLAIVGKYICTPKIFGLLAAHPNGSGEIRLIDALTELLKTETVNGLIFDGIRYDTGDKFGFVRATIDYALRHPEIGRLTKKYLRQIVGK